MRIDKMEYIVDAAEMQRADENTIQYFGVPQLVLMERAALTARDAILQRWPEIFSGTARILVAAGNGNNGGDGAALARFFFLMGHDVTVLVSGQEEKYSPAMRKQMEILEKYERNEALRSLQIITDEGWETEAGRGVRDYDLVVDALFGIGLSREISGIYQEKIAWLNQLPGKKAALDIPSGVSAQDGSVLGCAFRADMTITFGFLKRGMLLYPGRELCGARVVADIGITAESFLGEYPAGITLDKKADHAVKAVLSRSQNSHKGSFGKVLLVAGSAGMPGAALLAGEAVFRSGAGMLQIVSPPENREIIITRLPETMYRALEADTDWEKLLGWCDAVVIGPGIGQDETAAQSMEKILTLMSEKELRKPLVLDADGLNLVAASERMFGLVKEYTAQDSIVIMTPHIAELAKLLHCSVPELQAARLEKMEQYVRESGVILAGKDAATIVGYTGKAGVFRYYINQTGNSGMATAGSGDVLSGIMGALAALTAVKRSVGEKEAYFQAVYLAVYLHGLAGDMAAGKYGEASMKAGDLMEILPELLKEYTD